MLSCEFSEISKNSFFYRTPSVAPSAFWRNNSLWTVQFSLENFQGHGFILIQKYVLEKWGPIYQFSLKNKTAEGNSAAISFP